MPLRLFRHVLSECGQAIGGRREVTLSVAFVGDREMRRLNLEWRGKNKVTDVLSFEDVGEVLVCYPQARRQAKERRHSTRDEIVFLLVHGILHTFGFDHVRSTDAKQMFVLQTKILERLNVDPTV